MSAISHDIFLKRIPSNAHKYTRGSLLVLAGSKRYFGAAVLATLAAEKGGAGYTTLATPSSAAKAARMHLLCSPVIEAREAVAGGCLNADALESIVSELPHIDAICCGPGLTVSEGTSAFVGSVLTYCQQTQTPLLLDADALNCLAAHPELLMQRRESIKERTVKGSEECTLNPLVLTPHAGELTRLVHALLPSDQQTQQRSDAQGKKQEQDLQGLRDLQEITRLSHELGAIIIAKGPTTHIAQGAELFEYSEATPALAKAGTGDILAGLISSLMAQGHSAGEAVHLGVRIHSKAGCLAEELQGQRSVTALDVITALPSAIKEFEEISVS